MVLSHNMLFVCFSFTFDGLNSWLVCLVGMSDCCRGRGHIDFDSLTRMWEDFFYLTLPVFIVSEHVRRINKHITGAGR